MRRFISIPLCLLLTPAKYYSAACFVLHPSVSRLRADNVMVLYNKNRRSDSHEKDEEEESPVLIQAVEILFGFVAAPTPGIPSLALGFPIALVLVTLTESRPTGLATVIFFSFLAWVGRSVVALDDDSFLLLDGIVFLVAYMAANLFLPSSGSDLTVFVGVFLAVLAVAQALRDPLPKDSLQDRLLDQWDDQFREKEVNGNKKQRKAKNKKK